MTPLVVLITCRDKREGKKIARKLVGEGLAACVNLTGLDSVYRWKGKVEETSECLLIVKTSGGRFEKLRRKVREIHSYKLPEIIGIQIGKGDREYLRWLSESTSG